MVLLFSITPASKSVYLDALSDLHGLMILGLENVSRFRIAYMYLFVCL
jgi:hypothetical protein